MASNSKTVEMVKPEGVGEEARVGVPAMHAPAVGASSSMIPKSKVNRGLESPDCSDARFLIENYSNFKRSGPPARLMGYEDGSWADFPAEVVDRVRDGFVEGKSVVEVGIGGVLYLFDLYRMLQVDLEAGSWRSIAWFDVDGKCFFPKTFVGASEGVRNVAGEPGIVAVNVSKSPDVETLNVNVDKDLGNSEIHKIKVEVTLGGDGDFSKGKRVRVETELEEGEKLRTEGHSANDNLLGAKRLRIATNDVEVESPKWPKSKKLEEGDRLYSVVKELFLSGMRAVGLGVTITSIYQWVKQGPVESARFEVFLKQKEMTEASMGNAKDLYAWYGTSAKGVETVFSHGFRMPSRCPVSETYGIGVYLSPMRLPHISTRLSEVDDNGEKHVVLCRVISGKFEKVEAGSRQLYPSNAKFDTGVDDLRNPRLYVVWCANMNTHIIPHCVVSYRSSVSQPGFAALVSKLGASLPPLRMQEVQSLYSAYKDGKLAKEAFMDLVQPIVGNQMLVSAICKISS